MAEKIVVEITPVDLSWCNGCQLLELHIGNFRGDQHTRFGCLAGFQMPFHVPDPNCIDRPQECRDNALTLASTEWNVLLPKPRLP